MTAVEVVASIRLLSDWVQLDATGRKALGHKLVLVREVIANCA